MMLGNKTLKAYSGVKNTEDLERDTEHIIVSAARGGDKEDKDEREDKEE